MIDTIDETREEILKVEWKVHGFLSSKRPARSSWTSRKFTFANTSFCLDVYPDGEGEYKDFVGFFLRTDESYTSTTVIFTLAIRKADGTLISKDALIWNFAVEGCYGFDDMISNSELQRKKEEFMVEGAITFICILKYACPCPAMNTPSLDFKKLLESSAQSDLTVKVGSRKYRAHRTILAARSEVFASVLTHETIDKKSGIINIEDCDPDFFKEFLQHLYTNRANITEDNVFHLYRTADKYLVEDLKLHCAGFMMENLSVDNVCDVIALADQHDDIDLGFFCKVFFSKKAGSILKTSKWKSLMKTNCEVASEMLESIATKLPDED